MNIVSIIREATQSHADRIAIVQGEATISYAVLFERIDALAKLLVGEGFKQGRRIAFHCHDGIDYVIGALAILHTGAAVVPVPDSLTHEEIHAIFDRMDVQGILRHDDKPASDLNLRGQRMGRAFHWHARPSMNTAAETRLLDERCEQLNAAFVRFSSGTTGQSKGVLLSHQSIIDRTDAANDGLCVTHEDVILWVLGMSHHFVVSILLFLRKGATIIVAHRNFPFSILEAAAAHPITLIYGSPVHYYLLGVSDAIKPEALKHVRLAVSTAMKLPEATASLFEEKFGFAAAQAYGIIEIGLPFVNQMARGEHHTNTLGQPLPAYELRIESPDDQGVGDVLIRGKGMFDAYVSPWCLREDYLKDGWFATGDLGKLDEQGRLTLLGRSKTVIVCAGMKVFPEEVETIINAHAGVHASRVLGQEHAQFGQTPVAQVEVAAAVIAQGEEAVNEVLGQLRSHCMKHLTSYKVPVSFTAVEKLPRTPSGKIARQVS